MIYPKPLEDLIESYKKLPGIGEKSAERLALATIALPQESLDNFAEGLKKSKTELMKCSICGHLSTMDVCNICQDEYRNKSLICVLEDFRNVFSFEKIGNFDGVYHVLGGLISPIDNITPDDINIRSLVERIGKSDNVEIILALKPSIEGETTSLYIKKILEKRKVKISRLSYGIPMGADIDYLDEITLDRALSDRRTID